MSNTFTAIFDACVLYPASLRDVLMEISCEGIFRARWTDRIHDEWIKSLLAKRPDLSAEQLDYTRQNMNSAIPDCLVTGYEPLIDQLNLPDPNDRHVLAAAIVARAGAIVTFNVKNFPENILDTYGIEAQHPDDFLIYQFDLAQGAVCRAIKRLRARLKRPSMDTATYLNLLTKQQLPQFVQRLKKFEDLL